MQKVEQFRKDLPLLIYTTIVAHLGITYYMVFTLGRDLDPLGIHFYVVFFPVMVSVCFTMGFLFSDFVFWVKSRLNF